LVSCLGLGIQIRHLHYTVLYYTGSFHLDNMLKLLTTYAIRPFPLRRLRNDIS
jgi:hypothetical protein